MDVLSTVCDKRGASLERIDSLTSMAKYRSNGSAHGSSVVLALIVAAGFVIRLAAWAHWGTGTIESEGAEYARIAENLRNGFGFVGLVSSGPEVLFNPLFPFLIAVTSFVTHNYEVAGRVVSLVLGSLTPLPVFGVALRLFNRRVALIAAALTVLHPLLVYLSFMVYSEGPYSAIFLTAMYLGVRALDESSIKLWLSMGAAFGLAYLLRTEAVAAFVISLLFTLFANHGDFSLKAKRAVLAVAAFLALAAPEVLFLYRSTGRLMLEGKSSIAFYTDKRILAAEKNPGMAYSTEEDVPSPAPDMEGGYPEKWQDKWAFYGLDGKATPTGGAMRPFSDVAREARTKIGDFFPLVRRGIRQNLPNLFQQLSSGWFGAPLLPALALLGALRRPWHGPKAKVRVFVILLTAVPAAATFLVYWGDPRYYFIFVPLLSMWAANGLVEVGLWTRASAAAAGWRVLARPMLSRWMIPGLIGLAMIISPIKRVRSLYEFSDSALPLLVDRQIGQWLGQQQARPVRIMDLSLPLSYHAGAQLHVYFPYATGQLALRYLDTAQVDYVVLRRGQKFTKYYHDWLTQGIPDTRAELVKLPMLTGADKFVIYRWHHN